MHRVGAIRNEAGVVEGLFLRRRPQGADGELSGHDAAVDCAMAWLSPAAVRLCDGTTAQAASATGAARCAAPLLQVDEREPRVPHPRAHGARHASGQLRRLRGDRFVLLGPSGCGKSTLLKAVARLHPAGRGRDPLDGRPVRGPGPTASSCSRSSTSCRRGRRCCRTSLFPLRGRAQAGPRGGRRARAALPRQGRASRSSPMPIRTRCPAA